MSLDRFLHDVEELRARTITSPRTPMRLRWRREWGGSIDRRDLGQSTITVWLYPSDADRRTRAAWKCQVDSNVEIEGVDQGSKCVVVGELAPGRGVAVHAKRLEMITTYPVSAPMFGPKLGSVDAR